MTTSPASGPSLTTGSPLRAVTQCSAGLLRAPLENLPPTVPLAPCFFHDYAGLRPGGKLNWYQAHNHLRSRWLTKDP